MSTDHTDRDQPNEPPREDPNIRKGPIEEPPPRREPDPLEPTIIKDPPAPDQKPGEVIFVQT